MNNYCTLFDSNYLVRGLTLYNSLIGCGEPFTLYIYCFDDRAHQILLRMALANVELIPLATFENDELKKIKPTRSKTEYCWTCTPHVIRHTLDYYRVPDVTYLDADLFFFHKPSILLMEMERSSASVLITEHRYTPRYDQSKRSGIYCVQFITFKNDVRGLKVLQWWQDRCLEWCHARAENGKFGDQKYLDDWPRRFQGVHVLEHLGGGVAPWNVQQYRVTEGPLVNNVPVVFYHFHELIWYLDNRFDVSRYKLSQSVLKLLYYPYITGLEQALKQVQSCCENFSAGKVEYRKNFLTAVRVVKRKLFGAYNVIRSEKNP